MADVPDSQRADAPGGDDVLLRALAELGDDQRDVVVLRFVADLPIADVARILGKRAGAVKMLQARGLARLSELLQEHSTS